MYCLGMMTLDEFVTGLGDYAKKRTREELARLYADCIALAELLVNGLERQHASQPSHRYRQRRVDTKGGTGTLESANAPGESGSSGPNQ